LRNVNCTTNTALIDGLPHVVALMSEQRGSRLLEAS
jgi:hypothetical protein